MINAVNGRVVKLESNNVIILTHSGLEYYLEISSFCSSHIQSILDSGEREVRVLSVLMHREDSMSLFGFSDERERTVFNELINVSGIGPKGAMKIISGISLNDFLMALDKSDVKRLSKVPGLGAKTAQKIILELRNVLITELSDENEEKPEKSSKNTIIDKRLYDDCVRSFTEAGYDRKFVTSELDKILSENKNEIGKLSDDRILDYIFNIIFRRLNS